MATCPACDSSLRHTILVENLPAYSCYKCNGVLLSLVAYRHWRETHRSHTGADTRGEATHDAKDSQGAKNCPRCRSLMSKYRITADSDNRLDYCPHCEDVWLDSGEWELVEGLARSGDLAKTITQPWQRKMREEMAEAMQTERLKAKLGADYAKFRDFKAWLDGHAARDEVLALLRKD